MSEFCTQEHCFAPEISCNLGEHDLKNCKFWKGTSDRSENSTQTDVGALFPWSSNTLGTVDLQLVAARSRPKVIGIVGPKNAGKTTWLVTLYVLLSRGKMLSGRCFAGSYTFGGWENLAHWLRWQPNGLGPGFPPHTPNNAERKPGLLHLAFRREDNNTIEDVLFTDAPGEWFERWAVDRNDQHVDGARWIMRHADAFMFFVDSEALTGKNRGQARNQAHILAQRLSDETAERPVAVVWAKADIQIAESMRSVIEKTFDKCLPHRKSFSVSVKQKVEPDNAAHAGFTDLLNILLSNSVVTKVGIPRLPVYQHEDPLLAFRG